MIYCNLTKGEKFYNNLLFLNVWYFSFSFLMLV